MNKLISLEYCHVTPDLNWDNEIGFANKYTPEVIKLFPESEMQKCIMIDDLHSDVKIDDGFINRFVEKLSIKPDCVYLESSFIPYAAELLKLIRSKGAKIVEREEELWLDKIKDKYGSNNDFILSWENKSGVKFSCPILVATSYLYRLGFIKGNIKPVVGEIYPASEIVNMLSSNFLQVESNAKTLINSIFPDAGSKIRWFFY